MEWYLPLIWAAVIGVAVAMYIIMDGFDLGMAGVQRGADGNGQCRDGAVQRLGGAHGGGAFAFAAGTCLQDFDFLVGEGLFLAGAGGRRRAVFAAGKFGVEGELGRDVVG